MTVASLSPAFTGACRKFPFRVNPTLVQNPAKLTAALRNCDKDTQSALEPISRRCKNARAAVISGLALGVAMLLV
jgi:hypothetical protein